MINTDDYIKIALAYVHDNPLTFGIVGWLLFHLARTTKSVSLKNLINAILGFFRRKP